MEAFPNGLAVADESQRIVYTNAAAVEALGLRTAASARDPLPLGALLQSRPDGHSAAAPALPEPGETQGYCCCRPDGRAFEVTLARTRRDRCLITIVEITEKARTNRLLTEQTRLLQMIAQEAPLSEVLDRLVRLVESQLEGISGSVLLLDPEGKHLRHGSAPSLPATYCALVDGIEIGPGVGSCGTAAYLKTQVVVSDIATDPLWRDFAALAAQYELRSCWSTPIFGDAGEVLGTFAMYSRTVRSPTTREEELVEVATRIARIAIERKRAKERIDYMATHDALTGALNRSAFQDKIAQAIAAAEQNQRSFALAFFDLDNFKSINDTLGHHAGDRLLRSVAQVISAELDEGEAMIRWGGDEFVLVLDVPRDDQDAAIAKVEKIRSALGTPMHLGVSSAVVEASVGIALYPLDGLDADTLLARADAFMYWAKDQGRGQSASLRAVQATTGSLILLADEKRLVPCNSPAAV